MADEEQATGPTMVDEANKAAERLERANAAMEKTIARLESLSVERTLGGKTSASVPKKEESASEYAERALRGDV